MKKIIKLYLLIAFLIVGCSKSIDQSTIIGKYTANHGKGSDSLEIKPDGTYTYYFEDGSKKIKNQNKWEFEYLDGKPMITFLSFTFGLSGYGTSRPGFWVVEAKRSLMGDIKLCIDPDLNYYYIKKQ